MSNIGVEVANSAQIQYWNSEGGANWLAMRERIERHLTPLGHLAMERAAIQPGEHVLDIGCGTGETTFDIGTRVGARGSVTGVDVSRPLLAVARERLGAAGVANVSFLEADAQSAPFRPGVTDCVFSRFGVMFFADPVAAFRNLLGALRSGGRLSFLSWRAAIENQWVALPMAAALRHLPPQAPTDPNAPGQFGLANPDRVRSLLSEAGFTSIELEAVDTWFGGGTIDETVTALLGLGPLRAAVNEATPDLREKIAASIREALLPFETPDGVRLKSAAWLATAHRQC
jgi:SAM-dependent methyltransferase